MKSHRWQRRLTRKQGTRNAAKSIAQVSQVSSLTILIAIPTLHDVDNCISAHPEQQVTLVSSRMGTKVMKPLQMFTQPRYNRILKNIIGCGDGVSAVTVSSS